MRDRRCTTYRGPMVATAYVRARLVGPTGAASVERGVSSMYLRPVRRAPQQELAEKDRPNESSPESGADGRHWKRMVAPIGVVDRASGAESQWPWWLSPAPTHASQSDEGSDDGRRWALHRDESDEP